MRRNRIPVLFILMLAGEYAYSQEISHHVLVPLAGITSSSGLEFNYTSGEAITEIISAPDLILTQGFQQPRFILRPQNPPSGNGVKVYPTLAKEDITIELFGDVSRSFRIDIFNVSGVIMISDEVECENLFWQINHYPVGKFGRGMYFVRITSSDGLIKRIFKIEKL